MAFGGSLKRRTKFQGANYATACCSDQLFELKLKLIMEATSAAVLQCSNCISGNISRAALPRTIISLRNRSIGGRAKLTERH
jgi:hypothetical protein